MVLIKRGLFCDTFGALLQTAGCERDEDRSNYNMSVCSQLFIGRQAKYWVHVI
jgi:hypothetical protein